MTNGHLTKRINRRWLLAGASSLGAAALAGCGVNQNPLGGTSARPAPSGSASGASPSAATKIVVGAAGFSESQIIAELYAQAMKAKGVDASTRPPIGPRELYLKAVEDGSVQVVPEYTGNLLGFLDAHNTATSPDEIESALKELLAERHLVMLSASKATDQDVYCVTSQTAASRGISTIGDLAKIAKDSVLGGPTELKQRPYGPPGLKAIYSVQFKEFRPYDSTPIKVKDLLAGKIACATFFTTESVISENKLVQLTDTKQMILPQNVIPVMRQEVAANQAAVDAMNAVQAAVTTADLVVLNQKVDGDKLDAKDVAAQWLKSKGLV